MRVFHDYLATYVVFPLPSVWYILNLIVMRSAVSIATPMYPKRIFLSRDFNINYSLFWHTDVQISHLRVCHYFFHEFYLHHSDGVIGYSV